MKTPLVSIICAIAKNRAIGKNNELLWRIPEDLRYFKKKTGGHTVIMGKNTYLSIGRALPDRINIIITSDSQFQAPNCLIAASVEDALNLAKKKEKKEIFIIGGGMIYRQTISLADKLYLTVINKAAADADAFFPDYSEFKKVLKEKPRESNGLKYKFVELIK